MQRVLLSSRQPDPSDAVRRRAEQCGLGADPRVRALRWQDLVRLTPAERVREMLRPFPVLVVSLVAVAFDWWAFALLASFYFFLLGLRLVHDVFHANLGFGRAMNDALLAVMSVLMLGSMHAVRLTHLRHHRDCLGDDDVEGATARGGALSAIAQGVLFPIRLHRAAMRVASGAQQRWVIGELCGTAVVILIAVALPVTALRYHVLAMAFGQTLTGFFAVWTVHHDCDRWNQIARTLRHRFKSAVACNMFFHLEHHLYPRVPTCRLSRLAERLDAEVPDVHHQQVY